MTSSDRDRPADLHDHTGHAFARREPSPAPPMRLADASELVLVAAAPRMARFDRDDLVLRKGQYALRNGHVTPRESMVEDLLAIGDALDAAGIAFLLVRGNDERLIVAVDRADRKAVARAFADAFANEPFYAAPVPPDRGAGSLPVLLADGRLSAHRKPTVLRLYRPRVEPVGRLRYGRETAVQLEFWRFGDDDHRGPGRERAHAPHAPPLRGHRRHGAPARARLADARAHVRPRSRATWTSRSTWCSRGSTDRATSSCASAPKRMQSYVVGEGDDSEARYRQIDELKYALRSVYMFAPWVRRIFIATDSPAPVVAGEASEGHDRAQRGDVRRHVGAADAQLARGREPAAPHRGPRRALPLLERRHVLRRAR